MPNKNSHAQNVPQRTCVVCKGKMDACSLWSFILLAEGLIFDPQRVIQQRKQYVCPDASCLDGLDKWKKINLKKRFGIGISSPVFTRIDQVAKPGVAK